MSLLDNVDINNMNNGCSCQTTFLTTDTAPDSVLTHAKGDRDSKRERFTGKIIQSPGSARTSLASLSQSVLFY